MRQAQRFTGKELKSFKLPLSKNVNHDREATFWVLM